MPIENDLDSERTPRWSLNRMAIILVSYELENCHKCKKEREKER